MEESPSPKKSGTWTMAIQTDHVAIPRLSSILQKWLLSKKSNNSYAPPTSLSKILQTPASRKESASYELSRFSILKSSENASIQLQLGLCSNEKRCLDFTREDISERKASSERSIAELPTVVEGDGGDIEVQVGKLSLTSMSSSLDDHSWDPFLALLAACGQLHPFTLLAIISKSWCGFLSLI